MKKKWWFILIPLLAAAAVLVFIIMSGEKQSSSLHDEGQSLPVETEKWISPTDQSEHVIETLSAGTTAAEVLASLKDTILEHKRIDDIYVYEMYPSGRDSTGLIFFIHGQGSRKEEFLYDMATYAEAGYACVTLDILGCGERITSEPIMVAQTTVETGRDLDILIDYYRSSMFPQTDKTAVVGFSQGGSIAYWYAVYGKYPLSALVTGSTAADFTCYMDEHSISDGVVGESIWTPEEYSAYIDENNPVKQREALIGLPILSGHGLDDPLVPAAGDEALEQYLHAQGSVDAFFYYFDGVGHDVPELYIQKILPFLNKYLGASA